jgi:hypothetical protein
MLRFRIYLMLRDVGRFTGVSGRLEVLLTVRRKVPVHQIVNILGRKMMELEGLHSTEPIGRKLLLRLRLTKHASWLGRMRLVDQMRLRASVWTLLPCETHFRLVYSNLVINLPSQI